MHIVKVKATLQTKQNITNPIVDSSAEAIGARLSIVRHEYEKTQAELAQELGISLRAYHHYEKGQRSFSVELLAKIATFFELDLNWLVLGIVDEPSVDDLKHIESFTEAVDRYLKVKKIELSNAQRRAVLARWFQGRQHRRVEHRDSARIWVEMVR
ncbi:DNA-binding XRE family transcriptional regulator [Yoonia maritima]|uniref:DNA-binding XRE family transcriptional regulator n=1 Tax=Yoonia maritima TaxID=1435347 RepID=A0A2T0VTN4_9RHOB|nr:helix-turn-helix transcriptional regulator [Yoonia maritima]PRY74515.1 DNA-binding XRE family transcriptional regulator [Yoonia maritima]